MKKILIFINKYLPGYKAGGPIQTIANMVEALGDRYEFRIVTTDRDFGDNESYPNISQGEWMKVGKAFVMYLATEEQTMHTFRQIISETNFDLVYCQSFFNPKFTFMPLMALAFSEKRKTPVLIAPRGEFGTGAFAHNHHKKALYLSFFKILFHRRLNISFHASSVDESMAISQHFSKGIQYFDALDFPGQEHIDLSSVSISNNKELHLAFLARIDPKKNIDFALKALQLVKSIVFFDVFGNITDQDYYARCLELSKHLPPNITVSFKGTIPHPDVLKSLQGYDFFFFPTKNENFCHTIHEALRAGLPVLISDQTPWHEVNKRNAGWELPLDDPQVFAKCIDSYAAKSYDERIAMHKAALQYGIDVSQDQSICNDNVSMFDSLFRKQ